jgi:hypothetical protein
MARMMVKVARMRLELSGRPLGLWASEGLETCRRVIATEEKRKTASR